MYRHVKKQKSANMLFGAEDSIFHSTKEGNVFKIKPLKLQSFLQVLRL